MGDLYYSCCKATYTSEVRCSFRMARTTASHTRGAAILITDPVAEEEDKEQQYYRRYRCHSGYKIIIIICISYYMTYIHHQVITFSVAKI